MNWDAQGYTQLVAGLNPKPAKPLVSVLSVTRPLEFDCSLIQLNSVVFDWLFRDWGLGPLNFHSSQWCDIEQNIKIGNGVNGAVS